MREAIRVTVACAEETVSFGATAGLVRCLLAACASEPRTLEDLLLAVEHYAAGTTAAVVQGLLAFDAEAEQGAEQHASVHGLDETSVVPGPPARIVSSLKIISVIDETTRREAYRPADGGLIVVHLGVRRITGTSHVLADDPVLSRGVIVVDDMGLAGRSVGYVLGQGWTVEVNHSPSSGALSHAANASPRKDMTYA